VIIAGDPDPRSVAFGQSLTLVLGQSFRVGDLEGELCSSVRGVRVLPARAARWTETPNELTIGEHKTVVDDHAIWSRLANYHLWTVVVRIMGRGAKMPKVTLIQPTTGQTVKAKE